MFTVQIKESARSAWRALRARLSIDEAINLARMLDPDGYIDPATTRIVDATGKRISVPDWPAWPSEVGAN